MTLFKRLAIHYVLQGLGQGILLSVITLFMLEKGLSLPLIGIAFGAFSLTTLLMELPLGALADLYGRIRIYRWSRWVNVFALVLAAVCSGFPLILLAMVLMGLARALESGSVSAWEVEQIHRLGLSAQLPTWLARWQAINALGIALGALLGGYVPSVADRVFQTAFLPSTSINLLIVAGLVAVHILLLPWLFREGDIQIKEDNIRPIQQIKVAIEQGLQHQTIRSVLLIYCCLGAVLSSAETYWQPFVRELATNTPYEVFGYIAAGYFVSAAIGPMIFSVLAGQFSFKQTRWMTLLLWVLAPMLFAMAETDSVIWFALFYFLFMAVFACTSIPVKVIINENVSNSIRSTMQSVMSLALQAGGGVAAFGFASVIRFIGISLVWKCLAAAVLMIAFVQLYVDFMAMKLSEVKDGG